MGGKLVGHGIDANAGEAFARGQFLEKCKSSWYTCIEESIHGKGRKTWCNSLNRPEERAADHHIQAISLCGPVAPQARPGLAHQFHAEMMHKGPTWTSPGFFPPDL
jgi:hypothetical protein